MLLPITPTANTNDYARASITFKTRGLNTVKQLLIQSQSRNDDATFFEFDVVLSIADLFPELRDTFTDGFVYIGNGQHLVLNMILLPNS